MKKVTVKDIALRSGYSVATVSKTLNGTDRVGADTIEKIKKIAAEMGYRSSFSAQSLARKTRKIAIVMFRRPQEVRSLFEEGFETSFDLYGEFGIEPVYYLFDHLTDIDWEQVRGESNAVIVTPFEGMDICRMQMETTGEKMPLITLQSCFPFSLKYKRCEVSIDAHVVGAMAAQFLNICAPGKDTAVITGRASEWIHSENVSGFQSASEKSGSRCLEIAESFDDMDRAYEQTARLLNRHASLGGIFVTSYVSPAVCRCIQDMGREIRVIGVDLFRDSAECLKDGRLTAALFQNQQKQAQLAVEAAVNFFRGIDTQSAIRVKPELVMKSNMNCYGW